ncbi:fatty acid desaturase family protein [Pseudomarimonas arenosa]|uniref:Fatty acid desaturase n=1 Tax=Pseudomarimonas arenosa TaxID=2774145 RepID=A0AAW3ZMF5_9GAMM|nr:fatty acid desaturase [Pseudomarimonas arenosa]MBD8526714.1 fatty acid desaturase [Pseudomarimonas arenosa]
MPSKQVWRHAATAPPSDLPAIDQAAFRAEIDALRAELNANLGPADLVHLRKMQRWGRLCSLFGYATAWIMINPISAILIGLGQSARWTMIAHHVLHRGYDRVPGTPRALTSKGFAQGWRRFLDWPEWIHPQAWNYEHNRLHHFHTGELHDPDLVEHHSWLLRLPVLPMPLKALLIAVLMSTWKWLYYAPNTYWAWRQGLANKRQAQLNAAEVAEEDVSNAWRLLYPGERLLLPLTPRALAYWLRCFLPYIAFRFVLIPALFLPLGHAAFWAVLINSLLAEILSNLHTFLVIVPNHAGDDVYRYDAPIRNRSEFYLRQVLGSVNYPGGRDLSDFLHGYLNYQIEHHLWPDLPMLKYRQAAPRVKAICQRHGVPYVEETVFRRFGKLWGILTGTASMRRAAPVQ